MGTKKTSQTSLLGNKENLMPSKSSRKAMFKQETTGASQQLRPEFILQSLENLNLLGGPVVATESAAN